MKKRYRQQLQRGLTYFEVFEKACGPIRIRYGSRYNITETKTYIVCIHQSGDVPLYNPLFPLVDNNLEDICRFVCNTVKVNL